jgi:hypothetical protein
MSYWNPDAEINCIELTDQEENGVGGYAGVSGGVGHNVKLRLESQFSKGCPLLVKI